jgi:hypothetical protein
MCQQGEARKALEALQRRNVPVDLVVQNFFTYFLSNDPNLFLVFFYYIKFSYFFMQYKFAPDLIILDAYETVESWMMARNKLNPGKLIPAMMRYVSKPHAKYDMCCTFFLFIITLCDSKNLKQTTKKCLMLKTKWLTWVSIMCSM